MSQSKERAFQAKATAEFARLRRLQAELEVDTGQLAFVGLSVIGTIRQVSTNYSMCDLRFCESMDNMCHVKSVSYRFRLVPCQPQFRITHQHAGLNG